MPKDVLVWLFWNSVTVIIVILGVWIYSVVTKTELNPSINRLFSDGVFLFIGASLVFSVIADYIIARKKLNAILVFIACTILFATFLLFFILYLKKEDALTEELENGGIKIINIIILCSSLTISLIMKTLILKHERHYAIDKNVVQTQNSVRKHEE